jgi:predicted phosphate transport protein (TIGR00153 family)
MLKKLLPIDYRFYDFFEEHARITGEVCKQLQTMARESHEIPAFVSRIRELEHEADQVTHKCIEALHQTFITPIERTDILQLIKRMDDIADAIDSATTRIELYAITQIRSEALEMADVLVACLTEIAESLVELRSPKNVEKIKRHCLAIHDLESRGDRILRSALIRLFQEDQAMLIIKWKEIFERLEKAVDRCENVANVIEGIVISSS